MRSVKQSDFAGLVKYITSSQGKNERLGAIKATNCAADSMGAVIAEVLATQKQNTRAANDKTYHLLVAFAPGETPSPTVLEHIEKRICAVLGFAEHQRVSTVHHDTDHRHLHIAINKIHPTRLTIHEPYLAYRTLGEICTKLEKEFGLKEVDHKARRSLSENRATDMEHHAGIESLVSWIRKECLADFKQAPTWAELHRLMAEHGLLLRRRANGLVVESGEVRVKASTLAREFSMQSLESRLGPFEPSKAQVQSRRRYGQRPVPLRIDTTELYARYRQERQRVESHRATAWRELKERRAQRIEVARNTNRLRRAAIKLVGGGRVTKKILYAQAHSAFSGKIRSIRQQYFQEKKSLYDRSRHLAWADWLKAQALAGDAQALTALRSRQGRAGLKGDTLAGLQPHQQPLVGVELGALDSITKKGTVIYSSGAVAVRDDGDRLQVSRDTSIEALSVALRFAVDRYGRRLAVNGSQIFKNRIVAAAAESNIDVTFADPALELRRQQLQRLKEGLHGRKEEDRGRIDRRGHGRVGSGTVADHNGAGPVSRPDHGPAASHPKPNAGGLGPLPPPQNRDRLRTLSGLPVVRFARRSEVLLPDDVSGRVEQRGTQRDHVVRRPVPGAARELSADQVAAASRYVAERNQKRGAGIADVAKHGLFRDDGEYTYAGQRKVGGHVLILLAKAEEIFVLPVDSTTAAYLKRKPLGTPLVVDAAGIKSKKRGRQP